MVYSAFHFRNHQANNQLKFHLDQHQIIKYDSNPKYFKVEQDCSLTFIHHIEFP